MPQDRKRAFSEFKRTLIWIAVLGAIAVVGAIAYLRWSGPVTLSMIAATTLGVFFSVLLGSGLFAAAFYSDKSGYDQDVGGKVDAKTDDSSDGTDDTAGRK